MSQSTLSFESVAGILIQNGMLGLKEYVWIQSLRKKPKDWLDFATHFRPSESTRRYRLRMWSHALLCKTSAEVPSSAIFGRDPLYEGVPVRDLYRRVVERTDWSTLSRFSSGVEGEIMRDVLRTYQQSPLFLEESHGRDMLMRVLVAVARVADPSVGYCQGMNFVAGALLQAALGDDDPTPPAAVCFEVELDVFTMLLRLIDSRGKMQMSGLWARRIPLLKLRVYQLERLLRWFVPQMHEHMQQLDLSPEVITAQWFLTLFAYSLEDLRDLHRLWDYLWLQGWEGVFRVAVALLSLIKPRLLAVEDLEGIAQLSREWRMHPRGLLGDDVTVERVFQKARDLAHIGVEALDKLQEAFGAELLSLARQRLQELRLLSPEQRRHERREERRTVQARLRQQTQTRRVWARLRRRLFEGLLPATADSGELGSPVTLLTADAQSLGASHPEDHADDHDDSEDDDCDEDSVSEEVQEEEEQAGSGARDSLDAAEDDTSSPHLLVGSEAPTYWLQRYGYKLGREAARELVALYRALQAMDAQIDRDKAQLQTKLQTACATLREVQDEAQTQQLRVDDQHLALMELRDSYQREMQRAAQISADAEAAFARLHANPDAQTSPDPRPLPEIPRPPEAGSASPSSGDFLRHFPLLQSLLHSLEQERSPRRSPASSASTASSTASSPRTPDSGAAASGRKEQLQRKLKSLWKGHSRRANSNNSSSSNGSSSTCSSSAPDDPRLELVRLERESQELQRRIIHIQRASEQAQQALTREQTLQQSCALKVEEAELWRLRLCDTLQLLVEDANRGRSQKLLHVAEHYVL